MSKYRAIVFNNGKSIAVTTDNDFSKAFSIKNEGNIKKKYGSLKGEFTIGKPFIKENPNLFKSNQRRDLSKAVGQSKEQPGSTFKGKGPQLQKPKIEVKDRQVGGVSTVSENRALRRIVNEDFDDKDVARAFKKWSGYKKTPEGDASFDRDDKAITKAYNDYLKVKTASSNSTQYLKNNDPESALEEYTDASLAASRLPKEVRRTKTVGGGTFFGKGFVGTLEKNFSIASRKAGYGEADKAYKLGWFGRPSIAAQIEKSNLEATKIAAEADIEEAKALKEEGKERSVRAKNARIAEIAADKKASASFLNKITGGLVGRESLADLRVKAERAQAEAALKTAKVEGKAAEESAQSVRRAIKVQSGAFGARERAQKLESQELDRLEERIAEGRPVSKADQNRLKFLRDFSEQSPTSFTRGETQVRSVVAPDEETIQAARNFDMKKRGAKK